MTRSARGRAAGLAMLFGVAALGAGCSGVTDSSATLSVQFDTLPSPAVVFGDTLRNEAGAVIPLKARAYDGTGKLQSTVSFTYQTLDSAIRIDTTGRLVSTNWRETAARIVATVGLLQSKPQNLQVTRRPDSLASATIADSVIYDFPTTSTVNRSLGSSIVLRSHQVIASATSDSVARFWIVRYAIVYKPDTTVADSVFIIGDDNNPSTVDTTDASGKATRRIRIVPHVGATKTDSVVLQVTTTYRGAPVVGSPVRFPILLKRASP